MGLLTFIMEIMGIRYFDCANFEVKGKQDTSFMDNFKAPSIKAKKDWVLNNNFGYDFLYHFILLINNHHIMCDIFYYLGFNYKVHYSTLYISLIFN